MIPSLVKNDLGNYRVLRGEAIVAYVVLMADGSGWRVKSNTSGRRNARVSQISPRKAFRAYFRSDAWAKPLIEQLPDDDYRLA